jgi:hypothetical protein
MNLLKSALSLLVASTIGCAVSEVQVCSPAPTAAPLGWTTPESNNLLAPNTVGDFDGVVAMSWQESAANPLCELKAVQINSH